MKFKSEILLKISFLSGAIPFVGGWGIFLTWMLGRYLNASDFHDLEMLGFIWMFICFFVAIGGLFLLLIYVLINRKNLTRKVLIVLAVILVNIPSVYIVLEWQEHVDDYQFIKITNHSGVDDLIIEIMNDNKLLELTTLDDSDSEVLNYSHYDDLAGHEHYRYDTYKKVVITGSGISKEIPFSELDYGACKQLIIDKDFNLLNKNNFNE